QYIRESANHLEDPGAAGSKFYPVLSGSSPLAPFLSHLFCPLFCFPIIRRLMKKTRARRSPNAVKGASEKSSKIDRRSFVKLLPAAGAAGAALTQPGTSTLAAIDQAPQNQQQGPQKITAEMLRAAEQMIGVELTEAQEAIALP